MSVIVADSIGLQYVIVGVDTDMHGVDARPVYMQAAYDSKMLHRDEKLACCSNGEF